MSDLSLNIATEIAWANYGKPYKWAGDDTIEGFDCSGFVIEILKSVGILPRGIDMTADGLKERFKNKVVNEPHEGCLVFWRSKYGSKIVHVEYVLTSELSIGASGGGSRTTDEAAAIKHNAYIKVRPFRSRANLWGFVDPFA